MRLQSRCWPGIHSHLKLWPAEDPFPRWTIHMAVGRRPQFLTTQALPKAAWVTSQHNGKKLHCFCNLVPETVLSLLPHSICQKQVSKSSRGEFHSTFYKRAYQFVDVFKPPKVPILSDIVEDKQGNSFFFAKFNDKCYAEDKHRTVGKKKELNPSLGDQKGLPEGGDSCRRNLC